MKPSLRSAIFAGSTPTPPPPPVVGIHSYNAGRFNYYSGIYPFIDVIKITNAWWGQVFDVNADGYPQNVAPGQVARRDVCFVMDPVGGYFPPGDYVVFSSSAATLSVGPLAGYGANPFLTNISAPAVGQITFTATDAGSSWDQFTLRISCTNNTAGTIAINDLVCCKVSERALLAAGQISRPAWRAKYQGCKVMRYLDWDGLNAGSGDFIRHYSTIRNTTTRASYCDDSPIPVAVSGKIALEVGATHIHINTPVCDNYNRIRVKASTNEIEMIGYWSINDSSGGGLETAVPHELVENERVAIDYWTSFTDPVNGIPALAPLAKETIYFVHIVDSTKFQLRATSGGAIIDLTGPMRADGYAGPPQTNYVFLGSLDVDAVNDYLIPMAQAWFAVCPGLTMKVTSNNEQWNYQSPASWTFGIGNYLALGSWAGDRGRAQGFACLRAWKAFESVYPTNQVIRMLENQAVYPQNAWSNMWDYVDQHGLISAGQTVSEILTASISRAEYSYAPYLYLDVEQNAGNGGATFPDVVYNAGYTDAATIPDSWWDAAGVKGTNYVAESMDLSLAFSRSKVPGILNTSYECGQLGGAIQYGNSHGKAYGVGVINSYKAWVDGAGGGAMYTRYIQQFISRGFTAATHLMGPYGPYINSASWPRFEYFGLTDPRDESNPPRFDIWKSF